MMNKKAQGFSIGEFAMYLLFIIAALIFFLIYGIGSDFIQQELSVQSSQSELDIFAEDVLARAVNTEYKGKTFADHAAVFATNQDAKNKERLEAAANSILAPKISRIFCGEAIIGGKFREVQCRWKLTLKSPDIGTIKMTELPIQSRTPKSFASASIIVPGRTFSQNLAITLELQNQARGAR